jgi:GAF domain-containing protein/HAMP domain-containing protein
MPPGTTAGHTGFTQPLVKRWGQKIFFSLLLFALLPILLLGGGLLVFGQEWLNQLSTSQSQRLALAFGGAALFFILLAYLVARRAARPVVELVAVMYNFISGNWEQRAKPRGEDEIGQMAVLFNQMADRLDKTQHLLMIHETSLESSSQPGLGQLAQMVASASSNAELMQNMLESILRQYALLYGAIYLIDYPEGVGASFANLAHFSGSLEGWRVPAILKEKRVNLDSTPTMQWLVGKAIATRRPQTGALKGNAQTGSDELVEIALPIMRRAASIEMVIGALDLFAVPRAQDNRLGPFSLRTISELQNLAALLAMAIGGNAYTTGNETSLVGASGPRPAAGLAAPGRESETTAIRSIARAETAEQVVEIMAQTLRQAPYASLLLLRPPGTSTRAVDASSAPPDTRRVPQPSGDAMLIVAGRLARSLTTALDFATLPRPGLAAVEKFFAGHKPAAGASGANPLILKDIPVLPFPAGTLSEHPSTDPGPLTGVRANLPTELLALAQMQGFPWAAFLPAVRGGALKAVLLLGPLPASELPDRAAIWSASNTNRSLAQPPPTIAQLEAYIDLVGLGSAALERISSGQAMQRKLAEMESLWQISQVVSLETDPAALYPLLHQQVEHVMGEINSFAIVLYDEPTNHVHIPYMLEMGQRLDIPPFPLGEGLSSIVIRTRQPLLLVENVIEKSLELGAIVQGEPAKSWLGVPMLYGGDVIGLIIVQDVTQEKRFNEDDQRLLSMIAAQIAVVVHNARLLSLSRQQAYQERMINEITARIRRSADIQSILKTTAEELGRTLGARRASIRIGRRIGAGTPEPPDGDGADRTDPSYGTEAGA